MINICGSNAFDQVFDYVVNINIVRQRNIEKLPKFYTFTHKKYAPRNIPVKQKFYVMPNEFLLTR